MQTRSSSRLVSNLSSNPTPFTNLNPKGRNRRRSKQRIEEFNLDEISPPIVMMADQRIMAQLLQAPTEGYEDAIVVPSIIADNFELKHGLLTLVQNKQFFGHDKEDHQDSLNFATGGNFLDKMPRECLAIIESKSKVCYSCNKPVVTKVSTNTSSSGISPDVAEHKDMVKALLLDKKSQNQSPATVKAVDESYVTCSGAHSYRNCPATDGNVYRVNIQEFISQAFAVNYNQGNTSYRPPMMSNQIRPPGFPPVPNNKNVQLNQRNNQNPYQAPAYQAPAPQTQGVSKEDFSAYVKANGAVMRNMQTQGQNMQNQLTNLTELIPKFVNSNSASTLSSGTLPSNIIANPRSDLKAITTRSEATKDTVHPTNIGSTEEVQTPVVQSKSLILTSEPVNSPISEPVSYLVSAPRPNLRPSIPYPSRMQDHKLRDKAKDQREKFFQIFKDLNFNISFVDALILMPKFGPSIKSLLTNKDKLCELARTSLNEHCSAVLLKKLPKKLGDPGKFLIPYDFPGKAECLALADLSASINLMPLSVWNKLSLPDFTPTCMTLELADRLISRPIGVAEDVYVKVGSFHFSADFVVVDFDADPRVPLILGRSLLKTERSLIDVDMMAKCIDVIDMACEEYSQEVLDFSDTISSGNPTSYHDPIVSATSPTLTPFGNSDFLLEEVDAFLAIEDAPTSSEFQQPYLDPEGDILLLEAFLNDDPSLPLPNQRNYLPEELKICEAKTDKSSVDEPLAVELKALPPHLEYAFLEDDNKLPVIIAKDLSVEEKTALLTAQFLALADLSASINLMLLSVWNKLSLPDLTPTCSFHFSADFVVVDFDADPRVPLILGRSFLKTGRALIDVFEGELTLRVGKEAITFNLDQTSRYSANYSDMTAKRIDVIDMACEEYSQEVLEVDVFLAIEDDPTSQEVDQSYLDLERDIHLLEAFLNNDPSLPPPTQGNYLPKVRKELKICEAKSDKSSIDEPPEVELKDLPPHLEYEFLEYDGKLPVIIAKDLRMEEKISFYQF
nr:reverse transcriptase domain-containing protein [Tanacetum cinerariifolium]